MLLAVIYFLSIFLDNDGFDVFVDLPQKPLLPVMLKLPRH